MKKLTAGIFATLLAVVSADSAYAAIASQGYVDDKVGEVETTVAGKADKATTLAGYGITDAYTAAQGTTLEGRVSAVEAPKAQVAANVTGPVSGGTVYTAIQGVSGDVSGVTSDVTTLKNDMTQAKEDISALEAASATHATKTELSSGLAGKANTADLGDLATLDAVGSAQITDGSVATADIASKAVTKEKLADDIVTSLGKADSALQKTTADATYAVKALEGQVGTVSAANMGTTATTVVTAIKEVAGEAADAASAASAADTKAGQAQSAATAAQGEVDALEAVVNHETTGLAAAHTAIDALESGKLDKTATAERATADAAGNVITTTYATKAEIADMATDENLKLKQDKTDNTLATTNKTVVGAINEVKTTADDASTAAGAAQTAADAAQADATQALEDAAAAQSAAEAAQSAADLKLPTTTYNAQVGVVSAANMGTTATTVVNAIKEVAGEAAAAQQTANAAIPAPDGECSNPTNKCVLTFNNSAYAWEVIERGVDGE